MKTEFDALQDAYDRWGETINYMSEEEINEIQFCENEIDVNSYMSNFYERT